MRMPLSSRVLFTFLGLILVIGAHVADYNGTHMKNPAWPPHAKFHGGQTLMFSIMLGALTAFFAWRRTTDRVTTVLATTALCAVYWTTQAGAILYPGTAFFDPQFDTPGAHPFGVPVQILLEVVALSLTALAAWLALRRDARWS
jgi:hypothetical protein